jgi:CBS domain containing-hemolysin-like protein
VPASPSFEPAPATPSRVDEIMQERATVLRIIDGDTIEVRYADGTTETVRYIGIDTPETVAGLILAHLRHMPARGEFVETQGIRFTVMAADARRISLVSAEIIEPADAADGPTAAT